MDTIEGSDYQYSEGYRYRTKIEPGWIYRKRCNRTHFHLRLVTYFVTNQIFIKFKKLKRNHEKIIRLYSFSRPERRNCGRFSRRSNSEPDINADVSNNEQSTSSPHARSKLRNLTKMLFNRSNASNDSPTASPKKTFMGNLW